MSEIRNVAVFVGSLRKASFNLKMANALAKLAPASLKLERLQIGELPFYNEDDEAAPPAAWVTFRSQVRAADAVLFVTPEYKRSVPGLLKNAIDVGSRPYGKNMFQGKAGAVVSVAPGAIGGLAANFAVRNAIVFLDVLMMQQPEAYIGGVKGLLDEAGELKLEATSVFLASYMSAFADWTQLIATRKKA
jgi:chromate reductase